MPHARTHTRPDRRHALAVSCRHCGRKASALRARCPCCGTKTAAWYARAAVVGLILITAFVAFLVMFVELEATRPDF